MADTERANAAKKRMKYTYFGFIDSRKITPTHEGYAKEA
jgi:hypothetical protein